MSRRPALDRPARWLEIASTAWTAAEAILLVGLIVYAYRVGGASAVALLGILQALPSVVLAPLLMALTERVPRARLAAQVVAVRLATTGAAGIVLAIDGPEAAVFALVAVDALGSTLLRPIRGALVPMLARSPEELVSANVAVTTGASAAALIGPAVAAAVLAVVAVEATFAVAACVFGVALAAALRIRPAGDAGTTGTALRSMAAGWRTLARLPAARTVAIVIVGQRFGRGMLTVLVATTAIDLVGVGDEGVGLLNAALGLGGVVGSAIAAPMIRRWRLAGAFIGAIGLWALGVAGPALFPVLIGALAGFAVAGVGKALIEVSGASLLQRTLPSAHRSAALGMLESFVTAALAAGAAAASVLVGLAGPAGALMGAGGSILLLVALNARSLRTVEESVVVPERELGLLRTVPFFRPLSLTALEDLAVSMESMAVPAGTPIVHQGDAGDRFYIIEEGRLETVIDGHVVSELGPGDSFGEIALLRDVRRTATVAALTDARLVSLARGDFLGAVEGHAESAVWADAVVRSRLDPEAG